MRKLRSGEEFYTVSRWAGGVGAGLHGIACFKIDGEYPQMHGLNPEDVLGRELGEGAVIEVSVRVIREGRTIHNPWLGPDGSPNYRATAKGRATAKTCHQCHPPKRRKTKST
jgi:cytochrome c2